VRKAAGRKNDTTLDADLDLTLWGPEHDAANASAVFDEPYDRGRCAQLDVEIGSRS